MGILQHRLRAEENTTRALRGELESKSKDNKELEDQLRMYETLVKTDHNQLSSTPFDCNCVFKSLETHFDCRWLYIT